jgi:hypothetical protein
LALGQIRYRPIFSSYLRPYLLIWRASVRLEFSWAETTAGSMDHDERGGMPTAAKRPRESSFFPGAEFSSGGCCGVYVDGQTTTVCRVRKPVFRSQSGKNSEQCKDCYGPSRRLAALTAAKPKKFGDSAAVQPESGANDGEPSVVSSGPSTACSEVVQPSAAREQVRPVVPLCLEGAYRAGGACRSRCR